MTRKASKTDWAERKVDKMLERWVRGKQEEGWATPLAKLLRQERRRAVRTCQKVARQTRRIRFVELTAYVNGCEDCAKAVGGGET